MKKLIAILLALVMVFSLVACGGTTNDNENSNDAIANNGADNSAADEGQEAVGDAVQNVAEHLSADGLGGYKVGFFYLPNVEGMGKAMFDYFDYICELTNCEPLHYELTAFSSNDIMGAVESLVSQGADAIVIIIGNSPAMFEYLNEKGVYYTLMTRSYSQEVCDVVMDSEYFCGFIGDLGGDTGIEYLKGYGVAETLAKKGCKNIAIVAASEGETMNDERVRGMEQCAKDYGMTILGTYRGADWSTGAADLIAAYGSQMDGFICPIDNGLSALQAAGLVGQIPIANVDPPSDPVSYLEAGYVSGFTSEGAGFLALMYMQVFNALTGADRLFEADKIVPQFPGCTIDNIDTYNAYAALDAKVMGGFTPDEILALNSIIDPGMTVAEREDMLRNWCTVEYWNIPAMAERVDAYVGD